MKLTEKQARKMETCPICGDKKSVGAVVCWGDCYRGVNGFKNTSLSFNEWIEKATTKKIKNGQCVCGSREFFRKEIYFHEGETNDDGELFFSCNTSEFNTEIFCKDCDAIYSKDDFVSVEY